MVRTTKSRLKNTLNISKLSDVGTPRECNTIKMSPKEGNCQREVICGNSYILSKLSNDRS